ncbi:hypothetical protein CL619_03205 [archaeon]|nr:hypothetical protein [archaeon]|tara:strand:- start:897 stop:1727 length:831 start_codon:yes stop_codon:yes gene_type:complete
MQIEISLNKSVDENAGIYYNKAKKGKKKLEGAKATVEKYQKELENLQGKEAEFQEKEATKEAKKAKKLANQRWYSKFHNFISSEGFVCVGGRDATQNEILIKKHTEVNDLVLHTDMAGSPFFVIKDGQNKKCTEITIEEAAQAVACYSRAWKEGHGTADVLYVKPEQVSKEANPGEHLAKGSFMIRGKTKYLHPKLEFAVGKTTSKEGEEELVSGPAMTIIKLCQDYVLILPGREKKSALAKLIKKELKIGDLDDLVAALPAGGAQIKKQRKRKNK